MSHVTDNLVQPLGVHAHGRHAMHRATYPAGEAGQERLGIDSKLRRASLSRHHISPLNSPDNFKAPFSPNLQFTESIPHSTTIMVATRPAAKAGSWYKSNAKTLQAELLNNLAAVPESLDGASLPIPGARIIIAP